MLQRLRLRLNLQHERAGHGCWRGALRTGACELASELGHICACSEFGVRTIVVAHFARPSRACLLRPLYGRKEASRTERALVCLYDNVTAE